MITHDTFERYSLFADLGLQQEFLEQLASIAEEVTISAGEWLFHEDEPAEALYLIENGSVTLKLVVNPEQKVHVEMRTLEKGDSLGWSALVKPYMYRLGAVAVTDTNLIKIDGRRLRTLAQEDPEDGFLLMQGITQTMATRLQDVSERVPDLSPRTILSSVFMGLTIFTGLLAVLVGIGTAYGLATGNTNPVPLFLFCLVIPAVFYLIAQSLRGPQKQQA